MQELFALNIYFRRYAGKMLLGILCVVLTNVAAVYVPVFVRQGLDEAVFQSHFAAAVGGDVFLQKITITALVFGIAIILVSVIRGVFMFLMRQFIVVVSRHIEYDLKNDIYSHYQALGTGFYRRNFTGDMMARIGEDVSNVRMYVGPAVMYFVNIVFVFITVLFQMFSVNPYLSLFVLLPMPLLSFSIYKVSKLINRRTTDIQSQLSAITTFTQETFAGIRVLKSFGAEDNFKQAFEKEGIEYRRRNLKLALVNSLFFPLMLLLIGLSSLLVLYLGGLEAAKGNFTTGNIAEFMIYLNMLIWPVASLGWTTALVQKASASQKRINEFLNTAPETENSGKEPFHFNESIEFRNLTFTYENARVPALENLSLKIEKGKILGITGRTGSGKSTIAQLLMRQYPVQKGSLLLDGKEYDDIDLRDFRKHVAYVPQDVFLFSETIAGNIAFGAETDAVPMDRVEHAANLSGLTKDLGTLPNGLNTMLGERGVTLSGGQKQRVSIARAVLRNAELYVFDDCLSAVDAATEMQIIRNFASTLKGKTAVLISHRVAPLAVADHIVVLSQGRICEQGTKEELIALNGEFASLYRKQSLESEIPI